jgi:hypothetical protein
LVMCNANASIPRRRMHCQQHQADVKRVHDMFECIDMI